MAAATAGRKFPLVLQMEDSESNVRSQKQSPTPEEGFHALGGGA